ncbi:MAG TPA: DUF4190 domain-containing protein [Isosphaeraceae bacterium]
MAIDPNAPPTSAAAERAPAIENELPSYRAIHPLAVISLILGLVSILSFAHLAFALAGVGAILTGAIANRTIRRLSDVLTGRGLAQAGIGMGLVFSLAAVTITQVQSFLLTRDIQRFAARYCQSLATGDQAQTLFWCLYPGGREGKSGKEVIDLLKEGLPHGQEEFDMQFQSYLKALDRMKTPGQSVRVDAIEDQGVDGVTPFSAVRLRLSGPARPGSWDAEEFALMLGRATTEPGRREWYVQELRYPYQPSSYAPAPKPVDDGHGHAH